MTTTNTSDSNGREIFLGDALRVNLGSKPIDSCDHIEVGRVVYSDQDFRVVPYYDYDWVKDLPDNTLRYIHNSYETTALDPELLKDAGEIGAESEGAVMDTRSVFVTVPGQLLVEQSDGRLLEIEGIRLQIISVLRGYIPFNQASEWICKHSEYAPSYKQCVICEKRFDDGDEFGIVETQWNPIIVCQECGEMFVKKLEGAKK